ncbi:MptD family putative ECF transporter S component [Streptococcus ovis]|uniref:MptD family putative ECF transporter S component n=1 Tax=Streptococcus ovis TaxID=82806 RepID=UPI000369F8DE|nr:MptD family putative ECF transporter S component [Streptococcus ovis]
MFQKQLLKTTALSALFYFLCVCFAVVIDLGIFRVTNMAHTPSLSALFAGGMYLRMVKKTKIFGPITALGFMMSSFFFLSGHFVWAFLPNIICAVIAEFVARSKQYENNQVNVLSYVIFSLGNLAPIATMWIAPKAYAAQLLAEGKTQAYVDSVMIPATVAEVGSHMLGIVVCAVVSGMVYLFIQKRK